MKSILLTTIFLSSLAFANKASLDSVKVFLNGAELYHSTKINLTKGENLVKIEGIAKEYIPNTLRSQLNSSDALIISNSYETDYQKDITSKEIKALVDSAEIITKKINYLSADLSALQDEERLIQSSNKIISSNTSITADDIVKLSQVFQNRLPKIKKTIIDLNIAIDKQYQKRELIYNEISDLKRPLEKNRESIAFRIESAKAQSVDFNFSYVTYNASWQPIYDIKVESLDSNPSLVYKANIKQATGFDWKDLKIKLSSRNAFSDNNLPEISPWYINTFPASNSNGFRIRGSRSDQTQIRVDGLAKNEQIEVLSNSYDDRVLERKIIDSNNSTLSQNTIVNQVSIEYEILEKFNIKTDDKDNLIKIKTETPKAEYNYFAVPKFRSEAFLIAKLTDWQNLGLLPGKLNVYLENTYIGESYINPTTVDESLKISLGVDKSIVIKRERNNDYNETNFFGSKKEESIGWIFKIKNNKSQSIDLTIKDHFPKSQNEKLEVREKNSGGGEVNKFDIITWKLELKPGERKNIEYSYKIEYPEGNVVR